MARIKIKDKKTGQVIFHIDDEGITSVFDVDKDSDSLTITIDKKEDDEDATN